MSAVSAHPNLEQALEAVATVLKGQEKNIKLVYSALLSGGHILLEDVPGVGKTTLARAVAKTLGEQFSRIQFTSDMLPSDVLGVQVLRAGEFHFKSGPIFSQVVLADEINRASPKTQSALLEAMSEGRVTVDEDTHLLPSPFVVIATQNPVEHHGAYPLPESQLDRFALSLSLGYPPQVDERSLLMNPGGPKVALEQLQPSLTQTQLAELQAKVAEVKLLDPVADYLLKIVQRTRDHEDVLLGCSPRGALAFASTARAWAFLHGRDFVRPDDIKELAPAVLSHRLSMAGHGGRASATTLVRDILVEIPVPR